MQLACIWVEKYLDVIVLSILSRALDDEEPQLAAGHAACDCITRVNTVTRADCVPARWNDNV